MNSKFLATLYRCRYRLFFPMLIQLKPFFSFWESCYWFGQ